MSTGSRWQIDRTSLSLALARWHATEPDDRERQLVHEWLMDLALDPLRRGREDPDHPVFGRVAGTDLGIMFVPDLDKLIVFLVHIG